jgi:hypothetical protein
VIIHRPQHLVADARIDPLVQSITAIVKSGLLDGNTLAVGKGLQPQFALLFEGSAGCCLDELLRRVNAQLFELLHALTIGNGTSATNAKCE